MKTRILIVIAATSFCMACANISTLNRTTTLPPIKGGFITGTGPGLNQGTSDREVSGLAIHLDAPQRVILTKSGFACAEPSPDALQAYASSQALSLDAPSEAEIKFANALATSAGSIGLRTQSITLMRDHLYRLCEASYNGQITDLDVAQLLRRSQDMTLGVLAIEQLTGAVAAKQVMFNTNAQASANVLDTKAQLDRALNDEHRAEEALSKAKEKKEKQAQLVGEQAEKCKAASEKSPEKEECEKQKAQLTKDEQGVKVFEKNLEDAKKNTKVIENNLAAARDFATSVASGEFSDVAYSNRIDSNTAAALSGATERIVKNVIEKGHLTDSCISVMNKYAMLQAKSKTLAKIASKAEEKSAVDSKIQELNDLQDQCVKVFEEVIRKYAESNGSPPHPLH